MKLVPSLILICVGIWFAFTYPDVALQVYGYILDFLDWTYETLSELRGTKDA